MMRNLLIITVIAGFALAHGIALIQIDSMSPGAGSVNARFVARGD